MKTLLTALGFLTIGTIAGNLISNGELNTNININYQQNKNEFYKSYNPYDKTYQYTVYICSKDVEIICNSTLGTIKLIIDKYSLGSGLTSNDDDYWNISQSLFEHKQELKNKNQGQGVYSSFNKYGSMLRYLGTFPQS